MPFEIDNDFENIVQIKVIGVGGGEIGRASCRERV